MKFYEYNPLSGESVEALDTEYVNKQIEENNTQLKNIANEYLGGKKLKYLTQAEYDSLTDEEKNKTDIVYNIVDAEESFNGILISPNGTKFKLKVSDDGTLSTEQIQSESNEGDTDVSNFVNYAYNTDTYTNPTTTDLANKNTYYLAYNVDKSISNGVLTATKKSTVDVGTEAYFLAKLSIGDNNKYYARVMAKTTSENVKIGTSTSASGITSLANDGEWNLISYIYDDINTTSNHLKLYLADAVASASVEIKELMKINLTELYGAGNEPTKEECDSIFTTYKTGLVG